MQQRLRSALILLLIAAVGIGVSFTIEDVHRQLRLDASYVSFCNVNSQINCDAVLSSRYASLFGQSISRWAILFYLGVLGLTVGTVVSERFTRRRFLATLLFAASIGGLIFSVYMAFVSFVLLQTICLLCSSLYVVSLAQFFFTWRLRSQLAPPPGRKDAKAGDADRKALVGSLIGGALLVALALGEAVFGVAAAATAAQIQSEKPDFYKWYFERPIVTLPEGGGQAHGAETAAITLVEFSDFGCGHCAALDRHLEDVLRAGRQRDVRVVYRHFPLESECNPAIETRAHPNACLAAAAAECAGDQNKFWPYHRLLFDNQSRFKRSELIEYAREVGIDLAKFETCLDSDDARQRVSRDAAAGVALKISSTPTLFINGRRIEGALDAERLADALTLALSEKK